MDSGIIVPLKKLIQEENSNLLPELCHLIRVLTLDDDVRADVSKAHVHASSLAIELLCPITNLLASKVSFKWFYFCFAQIEFQFLKKRKTYLNLE